MSAPDVGGAPPPLPDRYRQTGWRRQFVRPTGLLGRAIGHLMAARNGPMNRLAVDLLEVQAEDHVLEVGFGPGRAIEMAAERATQGFVAGVDPSDVMLRQAARRNRRFIETDRVELRLAAVSSLPYADGRFTKALAVNIVHHWPDLEADLHEVRRVLRAGGTLLLGIRLPHPTRTFMAAPGLHPEELDEIEALLRRVEFARVRREVRWIERPIAYILATR